MFHRVSLSQKRRSLSIFNTKMIQHFRKGNCKLFTELPNGLLGSGYFQNNYKRAIDHCVCSSPTVCTLKLK